MARIIKIENQNTASNTTNRTIKSIVIPIQHKIETINPLIPSPTETPGVSKVGAVCPIISPFLKFLNFGKLSISPIPL